MLFVGLMVFGCCAGAVVIIRECSAVFDVSGCGNRFGNAWNNVIYNSYIISDGCDIGVCAMMMVLFVVLLLSFVRMPLTIVLLVLLLMAIR